MIRGRSGDVFYVVSVNDEAIDRDSLAGQVALRTYIRERDPDILRMYMGGKATRFKCRPITHAVRLKIEGEDNAAIRNTLAFHASVEAAENLLLPDGTPWVPRRTAAGYDKEVYALTDDSVAELGNAGMGKVVEEIGYVCLQRANLSPSQKKAYRLPLGFTVNWESSSSATTAAIPSPETKPSGST